MFAVSTTRRPRTRGADENDTKMIELSADSSAAAWRLFHVSKSCKIVERGREFAIVMNIGFWGYSSRHYKPGETKKESRQRFCVWDGISVRRRGYFRGSANGSRMTHTYTHHTTRPLRPAWRHSVGARDLSRRTPRIVFLQPS